MSTHFLDPNDVPRECPDCDGETLIPRDTGPSFAIYKCRRCMCPHCDGAGTIIDGERHGGTPNHIQCPTCEGRGGTGRLGNPDGARVEVFQWGEGFGQWFYHCIGAVDSEGPYSTEAAALEAARKEQGK